jgi:dihydroflavonol-4-reductase
LHNSECTSMVIIQRMLKGEMSLVPDAGFPICDVRDVAKAHVNAMTLPDAKNNRHLIALNESASFLDIAHILRDEFTSKNYN